MDTTTVSTNIVADKMQRLALAQIFNGIRDDITSGNMRAVVDLHRNWEARRDYQAAIDACTLAMISLIGRNTLER